MILLQRALDFRYSRAKNLNNTTTEIKDVVKHIFDIGLPDEDSLNVVIMLNALSGEFMNIRENLDTLLSSAGLTVKSITDRVEREQARISADKANGVETVMVAMQKPIGPATTSSNSRKCETCNGKHPTKNCFAKGGAREGQRDEVLAEVKARRETKKGTEKKGSGTTAPVRKKFLDENGKAYFFVESTEDTTSEFAAAAIASDITPQSVLEELADAEDISESELSMMVFDGVDMKTSVD
jgi:hypothetical protein